MQRCESSTGSCWSPSADGHASQSHSGAQTYASLGMRPQAHWGALAGIHTSDMSHEKCLSVSYVTHSETMQRCVQRRVLSQKSSRLIEQDPQFVKSTAPRCLTDTFTSLAASDI
jgi:hypothetical protein